MVQITTVFLILLATPCSAFITTPSDPFNSRKSVLRKSESDEEPDLFEYFDPTLSPHAYPNGVRPDQSPKEQSEDSQSNKPKQPFGLDLMSSRFPAEFASSPEELAADLPTTSNKFKKKETDDEEEELDILDVFDPTLSPHAYPNGIPDTKRSKKTLTVGILLMDHGSRNEASNQRLHDMARLYQNTLGDNKRVVVKAAHMEIASPTIQEQLQAFADMGVDEIVCHPYFLSPGRHVKEDIPQIVGDAIESMGLDIPVVTTSPVGSHTELMIQAIHSLVEESSAVLSQYTVDGKVGRGGM